MPIRFSVRSRLLVVVAAVLSMGVFGCVTDPVHNKFVPSRSTSIKVQAFTVAASSPMQVQCRPYFEGGAWTTVATLTAASTPVARPAQGDLFLINGNVVIPNHCWFSWHSQYTTELRFMGGPYGSVQPSTLSVYDAPGVDCLVDEFFDGVSYIDMMKHCRLKTASGNDALSIYVHASGS